MALTTVFKRGVLGNLSLSLGYHQGDSSYATGGYAHPSANQINANTSFGHFIGGVTSDGKLIQYNILGTNQLILQSALAAGVYTEVANATDCSDTYISFFYQGQ